MTTTHLFINARRRRLARAAATRRRQAQLKVYRLVTHFTGRHTYAQVISPDCRVLVSASTVEKAVRERFAKNGGNIAAAQAVGENLAKKIKEQNLQLDKIGFDRGGRQFAGRVRALAQAVRDGGLKF